MSPFTLLVSLLPLINALPHTIESRNVTCLTSGACAYNGDTCVPDGTNFQHVSPCADMQGKNYYVDPVWAKNRTVGYFTSGDFVSVEDFYEKCTGQCAEDGPIGNGICRSAFMAYGKADHANGYPNDTTVDWLCKSFSEQLNETNFILSVDNSTWTHAAAYNNVC